MIDLCDKENWFRDGSRQILFWQQSNACQPGPVPGGGHLHGPRPTCYCNSLSCGGDCGGPKTKVDLDTWTVRPCANLWELVLRPCVNLKELVLRPNVLISEATCWSLRIGVKAMCWTLRICVTAMCWSQRIGVKATCWSLRIGVNATCWSLRMNWC